MLLARSINFHGHIFSSSVLYGENGSLLQIRGCLEIAEHGATAHQIVFRHTIHSYISAGVSFARI